MTPLIFLAILAALWAVSMSSLRPKDTSVTYSSLSAKAAIDRFPPPPRAASPRRPTHNAPSDDATSLPRRATHDAPSDTTSFPRRPTQDAPPDATSLPRRPTTPSAPQSARPEFVCRYYEAPDVSEGPAHAQPSPAPEVTWSTKQHLSRFFSEFGTLYTELLSKLGGFYKLSTWLSRVFVALGVVTAACSPHGSSSASLRALNRTIILLTSLFFLASEFGAEETMIKYVSYQITHGYESEEALLLLCFRCFSYDVGRNCMDRLYGLGSSDGFCRRAQEIGKCPREETGKNHLRYASPTLGHSYTRM